MYDNNGEQSEIRKMRDGERERERDRKAENETERERERVRQKASKTERHVDNEYISLLNVPSATRTGLNYSVCIIRFSLITVSFFFLM